MSVDYLTDSLLTTFTILCFAATLKLGEFHQSFLTMFRPVVDGYINDLEATLVQDLARSFTVETWLPVR